MKFSSVFLSCTITALTWTSGEAAALTMEQCPSRDYSREFGPARDQGDVEVCFSFVAADLIGFAQGIGPKETVSALDVVMRYLTSTPEERVAVLKPAPAANALLVGRVSEGRIAYNSKEKAHLDLIQRMKGGGEFAVAVLLYGSGAGICTEERLISQAPSVRKDSAGYIRSKITALEAQTDELEMVPALRVPVGLKPMPLAVRALENFTFTPISAQSTTEALVQPSRCLLCAPSSLDQVVTLAGHINELAAAKVEQEVNKVCSPRREILPMRVEEERFTPSPESTAADKLASSLAQGVPVEIAYDDLFLRKNQDPPEGMKHSSIILGSRWNKEEKRCEFRLRNSWGPECSQYHSNFAKRCEAGDVWITESEVRKQTYRLSRVLLRDQADF